MNTSGFSGSGDSGDSGVSDSSPRKRLPVSPSREHLSKQSKRRAREHTMPLSEAQHQLAREYGFESWPKLLAHVEEINSVPLSPLMKAVSRGMIDEARSLLESGADVHLMCPDGRTSLHMAAQLPSADMVELLLSHGARNWVPDDKGRTALDIARSRASSTERDDVIRLLNEIRIEDENFRAAVAAIDAGDVGRLKTILREYPGLVHQRAEEEGWFAGPYFRHPTLLNFVANNPNRSQTMPPSILESTQAIIDAGADVDAATEAENGGTTLALVASSGPASKSGLQVALIELLVKNGADPSHGISAAVMHHEMDALKALIRLGAEDTLASAACVGDRASLEQMLKRGSQGLPEKERLGAAQVGAMHGQTDCVESLLATGLDINARLPHPYSPTLLHQAGWYGHRELAAWLVEHGADTTLCDTQHQGTPADWAQHAGHPELAEWLRTR